MNTQNNQQPRQPYRRPPQQYQRPPQQRGYYPQQDGQVYQRQGNHQQQEYRQSYHEGPEQTYGYYENAGYYPNAYDDYTEKPKRNKISFAAMIIGILASIFLFATASGASAGVTNEWEALGVGIAMSMIMPAIILTVVAAILNIIGWAKTNRTVTLISAICYALALLAFPAWGFVAVPSMVLQFIAFANMPNKRQN